MSVELVTGYSGVGEDGEPNRHVSSAEDGARQAGTVGLGCYALSTGSKLSATMEDANTLVVADGDVVMNGRHVSMPDATSFTIPTGVQGQKVSNIAVLRYSKAADSVESVTPLVLTGEPSADTPTDPAYSEGSILDGDSPVDMPLYRVVTDGINAEDPVPLFDVLTSMAELRDLVSHDTGWVTLWQSSGNQIVAYRMMGRTACVRWNVLRETSDYWECPTTLPDGARPVRDIYAAAIVVSPSYFVLNTCAMAYIGASGEFGVQAAAAQSGARVCGITSWLV